MAKQILLVDDDALIRRSVAFNLEQAGYQVFSAGNAEDALLISRRVTPNLVLLDIGLPGMDGLDALRSFKNQLNVPVIFLTARQRSLDEVLGLEMGADDYITKPFDMDVLLARVKAVLRRGEHPAPYPEQPVPLIAGDLSIDPVSRTVLVNGKPVDLSPREFDLLYTFAVEPNRVIPMDELISRVWGPEFVGQPQVVYVHVRWLREKIEADPNHPCRIVSVHGVGYKLQPQSESC
jgi:DNA-binding response OmpR family regulator